MNISTYTPYTLARLICDSQNIFTPQKAQFRDGILKHLHTAIGKDIRGQLDKVDESRSFVLFIGNIELSVLASLYLHCKREIDQTGCTEGHRKYLEEREKRKRELLNEAKKYAHPDIKSLSPGSVPLGNSQSNSDIDRLVSVYTTSLYNYHYVNLINTDDSSSLLTISNLFKRVIRGDTVFLEGLENLTNGSCAKPLLKAIRDTKLEFVPCVSGLFIASVGQSGDLPNEIASEFKIVHLLNDESTSLAHRAESKSIAVDFQNPEDTKLSLDAFLDNTHYLWVGNKKLRLSPSQSQLVRFFAQSKKHGDSISLVEVLLLNYGTDTRSRTRICKKDRIIFDREKSKINKIFSEKFKKDLIMSVGDKFFGLSIRVRLVKKS